MKEMKRFNILIDYLYLDFSFFAASATEVQPLLIVGNLNDP